MKCYRCNHELTESNASEEHIILNACGGRLKSRALLCKKCNSVFGNKFDRELAQTTNDIANLLLIKRQDGNPQPIKSTRTTTGEKYYIEPGGSPVQSKTNYEITQQDNGNTNLRVTAKNRKELKKTLQGLKKKFPALDLDKALESAQEKEYYINDSFEVNSEIGGKGAFRSIAKTAINFYIYKGGDKVFIEHLLPYLEEKEELDVVWMHYPGQNIYTSENDEITHVLKLIGDSNEKILYAYIELFNLHNFIVRLSESYTGTDMDHDYIFNVHTFDVKENKTTLKLTRSELRNLFINKDAKPFEKVKERYVRVLNISNKHQDKYQIEKIISKAVDASIGQLPSGTVIDEHILASMREEFMKRITAFIAHRNNLKNID